MSTENSKGSKRRRGENLKATRRREEGRGRKGIEKGTPSKERKRCSGGIKTSWTRSNDPTPDIGRDWWCLESTWISN